MGHPTMQENDTAKLTPTIKINRTDIRIVQQTIYNHEKTYQNLITPPLDSRFGGNCTERLFRTPLFPLGSIG